jgi:hypothetical protein
MVNFREQGVLFDYLKDGTHTAPLGAEFYAGEILTFMEKLASDTARPATRPGPAFDTPEVPAFIPADDLLASNMGREVAKFERANLSLPVLKLMEGEETHIRLPEGHSFRGLMLLMGPRTGWLQINFHDQRIKKKRLVFDRKSYYRRFSYWFDRTMPTTSITVKQLPGTPDVVLDKGAAWDGPREAHIVGVLADRKLIVSA